MMSSFPSVITLCLSMLVSMAFLTLLERKILSYSQMRKGPNKPSLMGIMVPISDAMKLITKNMILPSQTNKAPFTLSPLLSLSIAIMMWTLAPLWSNSNPMKFSLIMFMCLSSINVYTIMAASWSSNSKYSLVGSMRSIAQTISYEVSMAIILINFIIFNNNYNLLELQFKSTMFMPLFNFMLTILWMSTLLAELNRAPFDLVEGESELVSGFNTEYSSVLFTLLFMAEYMNILFMSFLTSLMFMMSLNYSIMMASISSSIFATIIIISRSSYPRIRYDYLMHLNWIIFLPFTIMMLILNMNIS